MGVLLSVACYVGCLRLLRWARLPVLPALVGAGLLTLIVVPVLAEVLHSMMARLLTVPVLTIVVLAILLLAGAAYAGAAAVHHRTHTGKNPFSFL